MISSKIKHLSYNLVRNTKGLTREWRTGSPNGEDQRVSCKTGALEDSRTSRKFGNFRGRFQRELSDPTPLITNLHNNRLAYRQLYLFETQRWRFRGHIIPGKPQRKWNGLVFIIRLQRSLCLFIQTRGIAKSRNFLDRLVEVIRQDRIVIFVGKSSR